MAIVFMHAYPADLKADGEGLRRLMGHTHYNELANDGTTLFATTRSTGQIAAEPVGFSLVTLAGGVVTWRFKPLRTPWPLVTITSPADHRLPTDVTLPDQIVTPATPFTLEVEATDETGSTATDRILVAAAGYQPPARIADGSDADALDPWPERHLLGTRLGLNRDGRRW